MALNQFYLGKFYRGFDFSRKSWRHGSYKVVFGREFPSKKCGKPLSCHILQDTNNFVKWRAENFVRRATLSQNIFHMGYGIPEIMPFPVRLPLIILETNF